MFRLLVKKNKGQSTLEYAILVVVVILALIATQGYLKRGVQGKMRESAEQIGEQFSPEFTTYNIISESATNVSEAQDAWGSNTTYNSQWAQRTGTETVGNLAEEFMF